MGKRVLIFDWDIHHGDGTQGLFYGSEQVLFMSLHRYDNGTFYPYREDSKPNFVGAGNGKGFNVNIAWNTQQTVDEENRNNNVRSELGCREYRFACENLLFPIAREFRPDLIVVSCGFDSAIHD